VGALDRLTMIMPEALSNIKAVVNYFDIKDKENTLNEIQDIARY
jgi:hypothetical protein